MLRGVGFLGDEGGMELTADVFIHLLKIISQIESIGAQSPRVGLHAAFILVLSRLCGLEERRSSQHVGS